DRIAVTLAKGDLVDHIRKEISNRLEKLEEADQSPRVIDVITALRLAISQETRSVEIGIAGRRLAEYMVSVLPEPKEPIKGLGPKIDALHNQAVARWIIIYLHLLRVFGDEAAHHRSQNRHPPTLDRDDLLLCLF